MSKNKKYLEYSAKITLAIIDMFNEESENHIDMKELKEGNNLTEFLHALANVAPNHLFNTITGSSKNHLEFNHVANKLCFQFMNRDEEEEGEDQEDQ